MGLVHRITHTFREIIVNFRLLLLSFVAAAVLAVNEPGFAREPSAIEVPAGIYVLEKTHASLTWRIKHMGMSNYTARFRSFDATVKFDPKDFSKSSVQASIDVGSLETDFAPAEGRDFNAELRSEPFFNVARFPRATFASKQVKKTGPRSMRAAGDFTLLGVTRPATLDVTLNGAMKSHPLAKVPALGFSARGKIQRMPFGLNPMPQLTGVADDVEIVIEAEFLQQP